MSTVTPPTPGLTTTKRDELHRRVRDPLEKVRGYIRFYVAVHGVLLVLIYLALCFWIGLALDYGFFKLFTVDWVQILPRQLRGAILVLGAMVLAGGLIYKVVLRLFRDFRDPAVALVLERRFPKLLGDRLITAVELADPREAAKCGYSQPMIDRTIEEAAERVGQVPIKDAFNWNRLYRYGAAVVFLTVGMYALACVVYFGGGSIANARRAADKKSTTPLNAGNFYHEFNNTAAIWGERNLALRDQIWPRRVYLELVGFPADNPDTGKRGELRVGKNVGTAPLRVHAVKWVHADKTAPEGWRPLRWGELNARLINRETPTLPAEWQVGEETPVDRVEALLESDKANLEKEKAKLSAEVVLRRRESHELLDNFMASLARVGTDPKNARRMRMLDVPDQVAVNYQGEQTRGDMSFKREENNEYSGSFSDLKETILFEVTAEDYTTKPKQITVVPPPTLKTLTREDSHPAYIYHLPPPDGGVEFLRGAKQHFAPEATHLGGDKSILVLPRGSDIKLTGTIAEEKDPEGKLKQLVAVKLAVKTDTTTKAADPKKPEAPPLPAPVLLDDKRTFTVEFKNVTRTLTFDLQFTDSDGVTSQRQVIIDPLPDTAPKVKVAVEPVIRKTPEGFKITPDARIPFTGSAEDDRGLAKLQFYASHTKSELSGVTEERVKVATHVMSLTPASPTAMPLLGTPLLQYVVNRLPASESSMKIVMLPRFQGALDEQAKNAVSKETLLTRLHKSPPREPLYRIHKFDQNLEEFDLREHLKDLKSKEGAIQPKHRLEVWLVATDTNIEHDKDKGPGVTESDEHFNFIVVGEVELMADIKGEEGKLADTLKKVQKTVEDSKKGANGLEVSIGYLTAPDFDPKTGFPAEVTRIDRIRETIKSQRDICEGVAKEYRRLQLEMDYNRFKPKDIDDLKQIHTLIDGAVHKEFENVDKALDTFRKALENNKYDPEMARDSVRNIDELLARLQSIMDRIGQILELKELIVTTQEIKAEQQNLKARILEIKRLLDE